MPFEPNTVENNKTNLYIWYYSGSVITLNLTAGYLAFPNLHIMQSTTDFWKHAKIKQENKCISCFRIIIKTYKRKSRLIVLLKVYIYIFNFVMWCFLTTYCWSMYMTQAWYLFKYVYLIVFSMFMAVNNGALILIDCHLCIKTLSKLRCSYHLSWFTQ